MTGIADAGSAGDATTTSEAQAAERTIGDVVDCALISDEPSA